MGKSLSPLRYPGGKSQLNKRVQRLIEKNSFQKRIYVEPFAGGFGVGLYLLTNRIVENAIINDFDRHVYHFWFSVLYNTDDIVSLIQKTPISLQERTHQKDIYSNPASTPLQDGFATLYLNRVNYSGVLTAGPIGGYDQKSEYDIGCRFKKGEIIKKIREAEKLRDRIHLYNLDANDLIMEELATYNRDCFYNIDPPYVIKGKSLYSKYFTEQDHRTFQRTVSQHLNHTPWIITYDSCQLIRDIYSDYHILSYDLYHSAYNRANGSELIITNLTEKQFEW